MTIAIGIESHDGIVLAADRQITSDAGLKYYQEKVGHLPFDMRNGIFDYCYAYAGYPDAAKHVVSEIEERSRELDPARITFGVLKKCVQEVLEDAVRKYKKQMHLEMLIVISIWGQGCKFFRSKGKLLSPATEECLGVGDSSVVHFLFDNLLTTRKTLNHTIPLSIYVIKQAKEYIDGCGGQTDIIYITKKNAKGQGPLYTRLYERANQIEKQMSHIFDWTPHLVEYFFDKRRTNQDFVSSLAYFQREIMRIRENLSSHGLFEKSEPGGRPKF